MSWINWSFLFYLCCKSNRIQNNSRDNKVSRLVHDSREFITDPVHCSLLTFCQAQGLVLLRSFNKTHHHQQSQEKFILKWFVQVTITFLRMNRLKLWLSCNVYTSKQLVCYNTVHQSLTTLTCRIALKRYLSMINRKFSCSKILRNFKGYLLWIKRNW